MSKNKIILNSTQTSNLTLASGANGQDPLQGAVINGNSNITFINDVKVISIDGSVNCSYASNFGSIEVLGGHTLNAISKDADIEHIIATNGTINFGHYPSCNSDNNSVVTIEIGSQGRVNLTGSELPIEEIIMSNGAQFQCVLNNNQYTLDSSKDVKLDSKDLKQLIKVTEFMYDKFADQKDIIINYDDIADLKVYYKLCRKLGKNTVQNFMGSKKALINMDDIQIDLYNIDKLINDNYFELVGIAKNLLKTGFYGKFGSATEILNEISSFLDLNDVIVQTKLPEEDIDVTGNIEEDIL